MSGQLKDLYIITKRLAAVMDTQAFHDTKNQDILYFQQLYLFFLWNICKCLLCTLFSTKIKYNSVGQINK